jgi:hypothetical protein
VVKAVVVTGLAWKVEMARSLAGWGALPRSLVEIAVHPAHGAAAVQRLNEEGHRHQPGQQPFVLASGC